MTDAVKDAARTAEESTAFRTLARSGYAANGVVHIIIGILVLVVAFGEDAEADQAGAFTSMARMPWGFAALWVVSIALCALAIWHAAEAVLQRAPRRDVKLFARGWGIRAAEWGQALIFLALGLIAASVALGARPNAERTIEDVSRGVLSAPGGPLLLGLVGTGIAIGGVSFVVMGVLRSFHNKVDIPENSLGKAISGLGVVGFLAKGVALMIVGVLLVVASVAVDPRSAGGIDGAVQALLALSYGPWLAGAVGIGFIAYGIFCLFRARLARMSPG